MIQTSGDDANREEFLHFYQDFLSDTAPSWILGQNPGTQNFEIATPGVTRLSVGKANGTLGINTPDGHRAQLDVKSNDIIEPLVIAGTANNYLSISKSAEHAKVVIGGQIDDLIEDKAKLHVTLGGGDSGVNPLVIDSDNSNDYLSINNLGQLGINTNDTFVTEQFNVRGNIKAGDDTQLFYLKNSGNNFDPAFVSPDTGKWLKLISNSSMAFWAGSEESVDRVNPHLYISDIVDKVGNVGIGLDNPVAKLAINGSLYIGDTNGHDPTTYKLDVNGDAQITGNIAVTGTGTFNGGLTLSTSSIETTSGNLLITGNPGVDIVNTNTLSIADNNVTIGAGSGVLNLQGTMNVNGSAIDFDKLNTIQYIEFKSSGVISYNLTHGNETTKTAKVTFSSDVIAAEAMLKWWKLFYQGGDAHYKESRVKITGVRIDGPDVSIDVACLLADGNYDNDWGAEVKVVVIATVASPPS